MPQADLDGFELYYERKGEGPPILGIMGFALDSRFFAPQIPVLTRSTSFITFDNRGIGRSTGTPSGSIEEMAADAIALLDHLEIERTILFGVSMGGAIAQRIVLDHPERVRALILGVTWARPIEYMRRQTRVGAEIVDKLGTQAIVDAGLIRLFSPRFFEIGGDVVDQMVAAFYAGQGAEADAHVIHAQLEAIDKHDVLDRLSDVSCPTLVIGARLDAMVPAFASEEIAAAIPGARLEMLETGHACMVEEMETFAAHLAGFIDGLGDD